MLLSAISFLAAFLLFQLELITSKLLLPQYGGSYMVWGSCMVFFQVLLLGGYAWTHYAIKHFSFARYRFLQLVLFAGTLCVFPGMPLAKIQPGSLPLVYDVFGTLISGIGAVFFTLSTISVVLQCWVGASDIPQRENPYPLYAASNLGSCAALISYPFFIEPQVGLSLQIAWWRALYMLLLALYMVAFFGVRVRNAAPASKPSKPAFRFSFSADAQKVAWFLYACAASVCFMAVSNILAYDIAPAPFIWVMPLALYLFSFVMVFRDRPWVPSGVAKRLDVVCALAVVTYIFGKSILSFWQVVGLYAAVVLSMSVVCHASMYQTRPRDPRHLSGFYLILSAGGAVGGMLATWLAPQMFVFNEELLIALLIALCAQVALQGKSALTRAHIRLITYGVVALACWPYAMRFSKILAPAAGLTALVVTCVFMALRRFPRAQALWGITVFVLLTVQADSLTYWKMIYAQRNYYGMYRVTHGGNIIFMHNGNTIHGGQYIAPERRMEPCLYYHPQSPVYEVMKGGLFSINKIAILGLGTGGLSAYATAGQEIDYFELDPDNRFIAEHYFSYLRNTPARVRLSFGDGRVNLRRAPSGIYDILIMDAFSGDYIPSHLMTREAMQEYRRVLKPRGLILFHVSNRLFRLDPAVFATAPQAQAYVCLKGFAATDAQLDQCIWGSLWCAVTWDRAVYDTLVHNGWKVRRATEKHARAWTDDYSSLFPLTNFRRR